MATDEQQQELLGALEALGGSAGNGRLRELLGWDEASYDALKAQLVASGQLLPGRGRGGSVAPSSRHATSMARPSTQPAPPPGPQPTGKQNISAFIWGVADLRRGDYKQSCRFRSYRARRCGSVERELL